jgi:erythromycin esterase
MEMWLRSSRLLLAAFTVVVIVSFDSRASAAEPLASQSGAIIPISTQAESSDQMFLDWAKQALMPLLRRSRGPPWNDLEPVGRAIGNAQIVALGDNAGCGVQTMRFRNRLFKYLVEKKGFTAIAIESGLVEARGIADFVRGKPGDLKSVVSSGIKRSADDLDLPEEAELVQWMRSYNAMPSHGRKLDFYGIDVPGRGVINHGSPASGIIAALQYLERVDAGAAKAFRGRLSPAISKYPDLNDVASMYAALDGPQRDEISDALHDMVDTLQLNQLSYESISAIDDYEWAYQSAVAALEDDQIFRQTPISPTAGKQEGKLSIWDGVGLNIRDRAMFDNIEWILKREGPQGKVIIFADDVHVAMQPVMRGFAKDGKAEIVPFGAYLHREYGDKYFSIGSAIGSGAIYDPVRLDCNVAQYWPPTRKFIDGVLTDLHIGSFFLDMRSASYDASRWLAEKRQIGSDGSGYGLYDVMIAQAFDALVFYDVVTAAQSK